MHFSGVFALSIEPFGNCLRVARTGADFFSEISKCVPRLAHPGSSYLIASAFPVAKVKARKLLVTYEARGSAGSLSSDQF